LSKELFISSAQEGDRIALVSERRLVEYQVQNNSNKFNVGDVYLGTVRKIVPGLNAAFIDIGFEKDAFLHYFDLGPKLKSLQKYTDQVLHSPSSVSPRLAKFRQEQEIPKDGKISQVLTRNQPILVQVVKEPISSKGPRLSCEISLAGRYIVLVPFSNGVTVSKRVTDKTERTRLVRLLTSIKPENFGIIIRTVAEGKEVAELDADLRSLVKTWEDGFAALKVSKPRDLIIGEQDKTSSILRDTLNGSFDAITVDKKEVYDDIKAYLKKIAPDKEKILKLHQGKIKLFEASDIEKQIKTLFGKSVSLPGGGYLIIEHTEALHVIDVNSGNKSISESNQEETALYTNIEAVKEVARQLRLRDMGGIIVVDFIDMKKAENRKVIYERMKAEMKDDRSKFVVLPVSRFGLIQITRERVRPQTNITTLEVCPTCNGTGKINASIAVTDQIENHLDVVLTKQNEKKVTIIVHPFVHSFFTIGFPSKRMKWFFKYGKWIKLFKDSSFGVTEYKFLNAMNDDIDLETKTKKEFVFDLKAEDVEVEEEEEV
jgi:ribonuclease G